jgi:hypothetical protein
MQLYVSILAVWLVEFLFHAQAAPKRRASAEHV